MYLGELEYLTALVSAMNEVEKTVFEEKNAELRPYAACVILKYPNDPQPYGYLVDEVGGSWSFVKEKPTWIEGVFDDGTTDAKDS